MDEERKKGITIVVNSTERHSKSMLVAALSKIDDVNTVELSKHSGLLPGLGFGLITDVSGIPPDLRNSNHHKDHGRVPPRKLKK